MLNSEDIIRLRHMRDAVKDAAAFIKNKTRNSLDEDKMLTYSLVRCLEIIGEAASKLSKKCQDEYPQIPWNQIVNMRNRLIHAYYDINLDILWNTVNKDLTPLVEEIERILMAENLSKD